MCNKQNYSFKKVYIITFIITVVSFIVFFSYAIFHGSVIKYDKQQNTRRSASKQKQLHESMLRDNWQKK